MAGGENNAYTTNDITNYHLQLPLKNLETAFWLESDRMLSLAFSEKSLDVQRKVVSEEFKEHTSTSLMATHGTNCACWLIKPIRTNGRR
jgi:predicted Zn-dependent peptidase